MEQTLELSVFRFNADTDFLRYYKEYKVTVTSYKVQKLIDVLKEVRKQDSHFSFETNKEAYVKVNGKTTKLDTSIQDIIKCLGTSLKIEPIADNRAVADLVINDSDFNKKISIFDTIIDSSDKKRYQGYKYLYYTSDILRFNPDFIGNAVFALAIDLIQKYPTKENEILEKLSDKDNGIWLYSSSCKKFFSSKDAKKLDDNVTLLKRKILNQISNESVENKRKEIRNNLHLTSKARSTLSQENCIIGEMKKLWQGV
jgi:hypothetical protein